jgi:nucleotide-binding universal stress UspA family protein
MPSQTPKKGPRIVVGVDGSPSSREALRWAVRQARLARGTVDAVIAWHIPPVVGGYGWAPVAAVACSGFEDSARQALDGAIGAVVPPADRGLVRRRVVHGIAAQVMLDTSAGADLLVVGSRGHSGFADVLFGSVSQHCIHHAHCPVVVIRGVPAAKAA